MSFVFASPARAARRSPTQVFGVTGLIIFFNVHLDKLLHGLDGAQGQVLRALRAHSASRPSPCGRPYLCDSLLVKYAGHVVFDCHPRGLHLVFGRGVAHGAAAAKAAYTLDAADATVLLTKLTAAASAPGNALETSPGSSASRPPTSRQTRGSPYTRPTASMTRRSSSSTNDGGQ